MNPNDKVTLLEKDKNYTFVYAVNSKASSGKHDITGQYALTIFANDTVSIKEDAKKMYASAAAVVSMAAISYLI